MEHFIWELIQDESEAISKYYKFLESDSSKTTEASPFVKVIEKIISDERDHLEALKFLYDSLTKAKPATDMKEYAAGQLMAYRDRMNR